MATEMLQDWVIWMATEMLQDWVIWMATEILQGWNWLISMATESHSKYF
jgi:hypothetical protein